MHNFPAANLYILISLVNQIEQVNNRNSNQLKHNIYTNLYV